MGNRIYGVLFPGAVSLGYNVACSSLISHPTGVETVLTCCPNGMSCNPSSELSQWPWFSTVPCGAAGTEFVPTSTILQQWSSTSLLGSSTVGNRGGIDAFAVQVRFQSTDAAALGSAYFSFFSCTNSFFPMSTTGPSSVTSEPTVTVTSTIVSQSQGLPTGAKAGIGVTLGILVIALTLLGAWVYLRRGNREPAPIEATQMDSDAHGLYTKPELEAGDPKKNSNHIFEDQIAELDAVAETTPNGEGHIARTGKDNRDSLVTTRVNSELQTPQPQLSTTTPVWAVGPVATNLADVPAIASQISAPAEEDESEEALQRRIQRVKAERERLAKIDELSKVEEERERKLAAKRGAESSQSRTIS